MHSQKGSIQYLPSSLYPLRCPSLVDLNSADLNNCNQRDGLQAYYLATTGIEIACGILAERPVLLWKREIFCWGNIKLSVSVDQEDVAR